jgi:transcriptional regulator with XRE-family HTH domain
MRTSKGRRPTELAKKRFAAGLRQQDIAAKLDISQGRYSTIENAKATPDVVLAQRIAALFDCAVTDLWPLKAKRGRATRGTKAVAA